MKNILFLLLFTFSSLGFCTLSYAGDGGPNDITSPKFIISTDTMNPVKGNNDQNNPQGGKDSLMAVLKSFSDLLLFMIPVIATVSFLIAGYFYIFSAGDSEKSSRGKTIIKWNIIAMLVAFFSYTMVSMIIKLFS